MLVMLFGHKNMTDLGAFISFCDQAPISKICPLHGRFLEKIKVMDKTTIDQWAKLCHYHTLLPQKSKFLEKLFSQFWHFFMVFGHFLSLNYLVTKSDNGTLFSMKNSFIWIPTYP